MTPAEKIEADKFWSAWLREDPDALSIALELRSQPLTLERGQSFYGDVSGADLSTQGIELCSSCSAKLQAAKKRKSADVGDPARAMELPLETEALRYRTTHGGLMIPDDRDDYVPGNPESRLDLTMGLRIPDEPRARKNPDLTLSGLTAPTDDTTTFQKLRSLFLARDTSRDLQDDAPNFGPLQAPDF